MTCLECPKPKYRGAEGDPKVTYDIAPDGRVTNVRLRKSSGNADTDRETLETMGKWRFDPKTVPDRVYHAMTTEFGNASSVDHEWGDRTEAAVKQAARHVADLIGASPREII